MLLALGVAAACDRSASATRKDTASRTTPPPDSRTSALAAGAAWESAAGPALVVAAETSGDAIVVLPQYTGGVSLDTVRFDVGQLQNGDLDLFARGRLLGSATMRITSAGAGAGECPTWPAARLDGPAGTLPFGWTVAFAAGRARPIAVDSIEGLPRADSARLAADVARLASSLPGDTAATFRGLPFIVRTLHRLYAAPGVETVVATVVRGLNVEANPRQEQIFLVAERDSGAVTAPLEPAYTERASGPEDSLQATDLLSAVFLGPAHRPTLVLTHDFADGQSFALVERVARARWRVRWTSAYAGC